jgi:hypothetical protein
MNRLFLLAPAVKSRFSFFAYPTRNSGNHAAFGKRVAAAMKDQWSPVVLVETQDLAHENDVVADRVLIRHAALEASDEFLQQRHPSGARRPVQARKFFLAA